MKNIKKSSVLCLLLLLVSFTVRAQDVNPKTLPEYVIITSENTKLIGGINITIDYKKSSYKKELEALEHKLQGRKELSIRNQTDLLNAMSGLGYEYVDAYNANAGTLGVGTGDKVDVFGSDSKFRINMVFKKK